MKRREKSYFEMENYIYILIGAILFTSAYGQDEPPLTVEFSDESNRYLEVGAKDVKFTCTVNRDALWAMNHALHFVREDPEGDVIISNLGQLNEGEPTFYDIKVRPVGNNIAMDLTILTVREIDDGKLICRVVAGDDVTDKSVEVYITSPFTSLHLKFGDNEPISENRDEPLTVETGVYKVMCTAEGSNPKSSDVHLFLHGNEILPSSGVRSQKISDNPRSYKSWMEAEVSIGFVNSGNDLECTASSMIGDNHAVKMPLKVTVDDPVATCHEAKAYKGEKYPEMVCEVNHEGIDDVKFKFQLGETGEIIEDGHQNDDFVEVKSEKIDDNHTKVTLKLYQAEDWHFNTDFYLLMEHSGGYVSKSEAVMLTETEELGESTGPGDNASSLVASVVTLMLAAVCALLESL